LDRENEKSPAHLLEGKAVNAHSTSSHRVLSLVGLLVVVAAFSGCDSTPERPADRDAVWKAQEVGRLRRKAAECLGRVEMSDDSPQGIDLEALQCVYESRKATTELYPNPYDCSRCYAEAGEGAALLGSYYEGLTLLQQKQRKDATTEAQRLEFDALIAESEHLKQQYFNEALQFFNGHIRSRGVVDIRVFRRAAMAAGRLGEYKRALQYLDQWEQHTTRMTPAEKRKLDAWRDQLEQKYEKKLLREVAGDRDS